MIWSATSGAGIGGNFLVALDGLRGEGLAGEDLSVDDADGDDLSGDDADCEDLAREARFFRGVAMVVWILYVEGAMLAFVDASAPWMIQQISNEETTRCHDVRTCVARCITCESKKIIVLTINRSAMF